MATTIYPTARTEARAGIGTNATLKDRLFATTDSIPLMISRLALGLVMLPHGFQKALGMFGGYGFEGTMGYFTSQGIPALFAFLAIMAEFLGSLGLISGFLTRIAAFGILCNMFVAALMVHLPFGFFMNWTGQQQGEGFEFHILAMGLALATLIGGAGRASFDRLIYRRDRVDHVGYDERVHRTRGPDRL